VAAAWDRLRHSAHRVFAGVSGGGAGAGAGAARRAGTALRTGDHREQPHPEPGEPTKSSIHYRSTIPGSGLCASVVCELNVCDHGVLQL
jgi:hypothetical protein